MSNFLALCQDVRRECGITGTGPSTVLNQAGELLRVVNWTKNSYTELQNKKPNWRWMRAPFTVNTTANVDSYASSACTDTLTSALITRFKRWYQTEFQIFLVSSGAATSHWLFYEPWDAFKRIYRVGNQVPSYPSMVTTDPQKNIVLGAIPDGIYTVRGDYQRSAQVLALDADVPEMPADFHQLVVFGAMKKYAQFSGAPEVWAEAKESASRMMRDLEMDQLDRPVFAAPLA